MSILHLFFSSISYSQGTLCDIGKNNGFEKPLVSEGEMEFIHESLVPGWSTTATDGIIEIWNSGYEDVSSYEGEQHAELNATQKSTLIKHFYATKDKKINLKFAHRGRWGVDVMRVSVGPRGGPYRSLGLFSDGLQWRTYNRLFIPELTGEYEMRFEAVSTGSNNPTIGNFLDGVEAGGPLVTASVIEPIPKCPNFILDGSPSTTGPNIKYEWHNAGGNIISGQDSNIAVVSGSGLYQLTVINTAYGCSDYFLINIPNFSTSPPTVNDVSYCPGATAVALSATGENLLWYTGGTGSSTAPTPNTSTAGTTSYWVTQTINGCESPRAKIDVTVHEIPSKPAVNNVSYCAGATAVSLSAAGENLLWYTTEAGGTGSSTAPIPNTSTAGITSYWVTQTINGCESPRAKIDVTVSEIIPPAPTVNDVSYCSGATAVALSAAGENLLWYTTGVGGTGSSTAPIPNTSTAGITSYWVTQTINGCESPRAKIDVTVYEILPSPIVNDVSYCPGATAVALSAAGENLLWYTTGVGGTGSSTAPIPNTSTAGITSYWVTQTINGCESLRAKIDVTVSEIIPPAPTVNDVSYCSGAIAVALSAAGENLLWYTTGVGGTGSSTAPIPNTSTAGITSYWVTQTINGCESPRAKIDVTVYEILPIPTVNDVSYCPGATAVALSAAGENLLWYTTGVGGTGSSTAPIPNTSTAGITSYWVTQTINGCESPRAKIDVTVHEMLPVPTVSDISYCPDAIAVALSAAGENLLWYTTGVGGTGSSTAPIPNTSTAGITSYWVTQTINGCESPRAKIDVTVHEILPSPTVNNVSYCPGATAVALSAAGENLLWYTTGVGGTGSSTAPIPNTLTAGITSYWVTQTINGCESPRAKIDVTVSEIIPPAPTVNDVSYCSGATAVALSAAGENLLWYTTGVGGTGSSTAPIPNTSTAGITSYWVTQTINGCESPRAKIDVTVHEILPSPTVSDISYCPDAIAVALSAAGENLLWYTTGVGGTGSSTAPIPNTSTAGITSYWVTQTINGCESPRAKIDVTVYEILPIPTVNDVSYCPGATAVALSAAGENLLWYTTGVGGTGSSTAPIPNTSTAGITSYWVTQTINGCESPRAKIDVTVHEMLPVPTVSDISYCPDAIAVALSAAGENLLWYTTGVGGTGSSTAPIPNTSTAGITSYWVTQTINGCESPRAKIDVTVYEILPIPTVNDVSYCPGATAVALSAAGENLLWYTTGVGGTGSSTAPIPNTSTAGITSYWVTQTINGCESPRAKIDVTVHEMLPVPTVSDISYCPDAIAVALSAAGENLLWYTTGVGGTGSSTAPIPNTSTAGITSYWVTQTINGCESPRAKIDVTVHEILPSPTVNDVSYCPGATAVALSAAGENLLWYTTGVGGTGSSTAPIPNTSTAGITSYWVTQTINGCESPRAKIDVTVHEILPSPTVNDVSYCPGATAVALSATGENLLWYTGGTGSSTAPIPNTSTAGTTSYWVTQTINGCESPRAKIDVTVHEIPSKPTVNNVSYCSGATAVALSAAGENLLWYTTGVGGTGSSTAPIPNTSTAGITSYWVTQTINGCESPRAKIDVTVYEILPSPTVNDVSYCPGATAVALSATGENLLWYTGGTGSSTAPTPNTSTAGTTSYWVTQTINGCESPRAKIDVTVHEIPSKPAVNNVSYCAGATAVSLSAAGENLLWYTTEAGGTGSSTAPIPNTSTAGITSYWVTQTINGCESPRAKIDVTVSEILPIPTVNDVSYCPGATAVALSAAGENLLWYTTGVGGTGSSTAPIPNTSTAGITSYWVTQTINGCESPRAKIDVTVHEMLPVPTVSDISYCPDAIAVALSAAGENLLWYTTGVGGTGSSTAPIPNTSTAGITSYWVTQTINGCESPRAKIDVTVHEILPSPTVNDVSYCPGATAVALSAAGENLLWYTTGVGGTGSSTAPIPNTLTAGITSYWVTQTINGCESPRAKIDVTVHEILPSPTVNDVSYCPGATAVALSATGENLLWYTGGTGSSTAPIPNTSTAGTTSYWVTQTINGCESPRAKIDVTVHEILPSPTVNDVSYCPGATAVALSAAGENLLWYTTGVGGTGSSTAPIPNTSTAGITSYWVTQTINGCESPRAKIDVTVHEILPSPTVNNVSYCPGATAVALSAAGENLLWYTTGVGGTGSSTAPIPNTLTAGITSYWVTQTINGCESPRAKIDVTVHEILPSPIVNDVSYCPDATAVALSAAGENLLWYTTGVGGTGSSTAPIPNTSTAGITSYWVTQTINGCESPRAKVDVTVHEILPSPTVNDVSYCPDAIAVALGAAGENLLWYTTGVGGTGSSTAPIPNTSTAGITSYWVTQTINGCESPRAKIDVTVHEILPSPIVNDVSYCPDATAVALSAAGENLLWYTTGVGGTGSSTAPIPNTSTAGITSYWVTQTINGCESPRAKVDVTVHEILPSPIVNDVSYCPDATAVALSAAGENLLWYTTGVGGTGSSIAPIPNTLTAGITSYWVTQTINGCESPRAKIDVTVHEILPSPTVNNVSYCSGATAVALSAAGENLLWYTTGVDGTGSSTAPIPNTSTAGITSYWVTQTINGCESPRAKIDVTVHEMLPVPTVSDISYCPDAIAVALSAAGENLLWYTTGVGGTGNSIAPIPNTSTAGITSYWVTQTINGCESPRAKIDVTVHEILPSPIVNDVSYCPDATAVALSAAGENLLWYTTGVGGTGSSIAPIPNTLTAGITSYWVTQTINGCESPRAKIDVTVHEILPSPTVNNVSYCSGATAVALSAAGENLLWYTTGVDGTGSSTAPIPNTSTAGITSYWVTQTINGCESPRAKIDVTVHEMLPVPTVSDISYCPDAIAVALSAAGENLLWYTTGVDGTGSSTAPIPNTSTAGITSYWVTQTINGCESLRAKIDVTVHEILPSPTVNDISYCAGAIAVALSAAGENLLWYTTGVGGTGSSTAPIPNTSTAGITSYWVTQTINGCESPRAKVDVTVHEILPSPTVNDVSYCPDAIAVALGAAGENLLWYTGGTGSSTAPIPNTSTAGITSYWVTQTINGCESPRAKIDVTVHEMLPIPTVNDVSYCAGATAVALSAVGENLLWYTTGVGGTGSSTAPIPNTLTAGITSYWVTQTINGCESPRAKIDVTVHEILPIPTVNDVSYCPSATAVALSAVGENLLWYTTGVGGTGSSTAPIPNTSTAGITSYWVTQTINGCESPRAKIDVTVHPMPTSPISTGNKTVCTGEDKTLSVTVPEGISVDWFDSAVQGNLLASNNNSFIPEKSGTYYVQSKDIRSGCINPVRTAVTLSLLSFTKAPTIEASKTEIYAGETIILKISPGVNNSFTWSTGQTGTEIAINPVISTTYKVILTNEFGCSDTSSIHIKVNDWNVDLGEDKYICDNQTITLQPEEIYTLASYTWSTDETTSQIKVEKTSSYSVSATIGKIEKSDTISITYSDLDFEEPSFFGCIAFIDVAVKGGIPPYSYSLNGIDYKSSPQFLNIKSGTYTLYVKDNVGCVKLTTVVIESLDIPSYFSPNGDGVNDLWKIENLDDCVSAEILIFDRYGRKLHKMDAIGSWDGTYLNKPVPADTYWYVIDFKDGVNKVLKGSVTIKRR